MKAGTVSLRHYLSDHPGVFIGTGGKFGEPNFFIAEDNWSRGRGWYESLFDDGGQAAAIGECSPCYTRAHAYRGVPERMAQVVLGARLVYLVRESISCANRSRACSRCTCVRCQPAGSDAAWLRPCSTTVTSGLACTGSSSRHFSTTSTGLSRLLTARRARADDSAIPPELRDRLAERLAADLRRFEHLLGYPVPSHWEWSQR